MKILLNSKELESKDFVEAKIWKQLFDILLESFINETHGVTSIDIDGEVYDNSLVCSVEEIPSNIKELNIISEDNNTIASRGIKNSLDLIKAIEKTSLEIAQHMRNDEVKKSSLKIINLMESFKPLVEFLNSLSISFKIDFNEIDFGGESLSKKIDSLVDNLNDIVGAQKKGDYVELADYYQYQMPEDLEVWKKIMLLMDKEIKAFVVNN